MKRVVDPFAPIQCWAGDASPSIITGYQNYEELPRQSQNARQLRVREQASALVLAPLPDSFRVGS